MIEPITVDFETTGIEGNPISNPPDPVGLAVYVPGMEPQYLAWGHPAENNCSRGEGLQYAKRLIVSSRRPVLFHNAPFDLAVLNGALGTTWLYADWNLYHD